MQPAPPPVRELRTYDELARALRLALLAPQLTEENIAAGCERARREALAGIIVRPCDLDQAARWTGASVALGAAIDWPHGFSTTAVKQYAVRDAVRRGAKEISVPMNTGKLLSRQFQYLEMEFLQLTEACHESGAVLVAHVENRYLTDEHKIVACRIAKRAGADFLAASEPSDLALLAQHARDRIQLSYRDERPLDESLDAVFAAWTAGCTRIESVEAAALLQAWKLRIAPPVTSDGAA